MTMRRSESSETGRRPCGSGPSRRSPGRAGARSAPAPAPAGRAGRCRPGRDRPFAVFHARHVARAQEGDRQAPGRDFARLVVQRHHQAFEVDGAVRVARTLPTTVVPCASSSGPGASSRPGESWLPAMTTMFRCGARALACCRKRYSCCCDAADGLALSKTSPAISSASACSATMVSSSQSRKHWCS